MIGTRMNLRSCWPFMSTLAASLAMLLLLPGCGTFEVGLEQGMTPVSPSPAVTTLSVPQTAGESRPGTDVPLSEPDLNPIPGLQVIAISWSGEMKGTCESLMINYGGEAAIGPCKQSYRDMRPLDNRFEHGQWWDYWIERFAPFHSENLAPLGQISVQGLGHETASAAWQRAAARWAELLWVEMKTDGQSESWTTALSWQQAMPDRPAECGSLQVSVYGTAQASYGLCDSEAPATQVEAWLASAEWEPFDARYISKQPWSDDSLEFYGSGPLEMSAAESQELHRWAEALFNRLILGELMGSGSQQVQSLLQPSTTIIPETAIANTPAPDTAASPSPPVLQVTIAPLDLSASQFYQSEAGEFSIRYPRQATFYEGEVPSVDGVLLAAPDSIAIRISNDTLLTLTHFDLVPDTTLAGFTDAQSLCATVSAGAGLPYELNGRPFLRFEDTPCGPYGATYFYTIQDDKGYRFTIESSQPYRWIEDGIEPILVSFHSPAVGLQ